MTYEYLCNNCGFQSEVQQSIKDDPLTHCDKCGRDSLKRLISASSFVLKGDGWAADNYSKKQ